MINKVGREIPDEILKKNNKTGYQGMNYRDNVPYKKAAPTVRSLNDPTRSKLCASLREALEKCELHDGMYFGFHHHFRDGDYIINMVMQEVAQMGYKDITICASSMGAAHDAIAPLIESGVVAGIQSSGVRGKIGEAISYGKFKKPAIIRSHGGRVRAIEEGDIHLDVAFIGAPTADEYGNARGVGGKSDCGVLSYSMVDAKYADKVVVIDHHRRAEETIENPTLAYIESYASSTAELVTEILQYILNRKILIRLEAEALLAGMTIDTNRFAVKTGVRTFEAAAWLRRSGADTAEVKRFFQMNRETFMVRAKAIASADFIPGGYAVAICEGEHQDAQVINSQVADELLDIKGIKASFVAGKNAAGLTCISARSLGEVNVQVILEKLGGGGHLNVAGAQVKETPEETLEKIKELIKEGE